MYWIPPAGPPPPRGGRPPWSSEPVSDPDMLLLLLPIRPLSTVYPIRWFIFHERRSLYFRVPLVYSSPEIYVNMGSALVLYIMMEFHILAAWMIWNRYLHSIDLPLSLYRRKGERDRVLLNLRCTGSLEPLLKIKYKENCAKNGISWQSKAQPKFFELIWVDLSFNSIIWFEGDNSLTC